MNFFYFVTEIKIPANIISNPSIKIIGHVDKHFLFIFLDNDKPNFELIVDNVKNINIKSYLIFPIIKYCNEEVKEEKKVVIELVAITTLLSTFNNNNNGETNIPPPIPNIVDKIPITKADKDINNKLYVFIFKFIDG